MGVDTVNIFKKRLDKHRTNQKVFFYFNADLTGTGSLPICIRMYDGQDEDYLCPQNTLDWIGLLIYS